MVSAVTSSCCPTIISTRLDTTRLIFFDMNSRIATAGQQITPTHRCFSRPPQSQTHYLSTGPIGNENGLTIMTDRIAAIAAAATALNKFLKPLAIAAMSIATLMPLQPCRQARRTCFLQSYKKKTTSRACTTQQGLSIVLTFEVGSLRIAHSITTKAEPIIVCASDHRVQGRGAMHIRMAT